MTKQLKKGLLTVLLFVMSICCAFSVNSFATVKAADVPFADTLANFKVAANIVDDESTSDIDESIIVANDARVKAAMENKVATEYFVLMYKSQTMGQLSQEESDLFAPILAVYNANGAVDFYAGVTSTAYNIANKKGYSYRNHTDVEKLEAQFVGLCTAEKAVDLAFLKNIPNFVFVDVEGVSTPKDLADARAKINAWKDVIDAAVAKVKDIKVTTDNENLVSIHDGTSYISGYTVVIESNDSVVEARTAIEAVKTQGDGSFVELEEGLVKAAENALTASRKAISDVEGLIKDAYALYEQGKCYTNKAGIDAAYVAYRALNGGDNGPVTLNDLFAMVNDEQDAQIAMMKDLCDMQEHMIKGCPADCLGHRGRCFYGVENFIDDIEIVDDAATDYAFAYDVTTREKIDLAQENFANLDADVKADALNCVANYQDLLDAEEAWKAYIAEIDAMIDAFNALLPIEQSSRKELFAAMNAAFNMPLSDKENQLTGNNGQLKGFNNNEIDPVNPGNSYNEDITTSQGLYNHYTEIISAVRAATMGIAADLEELLPMPVRFNNAFNTLFNDVKTEINNLKDTDGELDELYIGAIGETKYNNFLAMVDEYETLLAAGEVWADAVVAIGVVCTDKFDEIDAASAAYDAIAEIYPVGYVVADDLASFSLVYNEKAYSAYYEELNLKSLDYIVLQLAIAEAKADADRLVRPELAGDYAAYAAEVARATATYEALKAFDKDEDVCAECDTQKYYQDTYADSYAAYLKALDYVAANSVEAAIAKIADKENANNILAARVAYETLTDAQKEEVRNIEDLTDVEDIVNGFIANVNALLVAAGFDGSDVTAVEVVFDADKLTEGFYKLNVKTAKAYVDEYESWSDTLKAYAYVIYGEDETTDTDDVTVTVVAAKALLDAMIEVAGTEKTNKIGAIDTIIASYLRYYETGVGETLAKEVIQSYIDALDATQCDLLENYADWVALQNDFAMAAELANAIEKLYAVEDITNDTVINFYVVKSIYESLSDPQKALVVVETGYTTRETLELIEVKVLDADNIININDIVGKLGELEGAIDALSGRVDTLDEELVSLRDKYKTLNKSYKDFVKATTEFNGDWESLDKLVETVKADVAVKVLEIETAIADLEDSLKCEIQKAAAKALADAKAYTDALANGSVASNAADIATNKAAIAAAQAEVDALELVVAAIDFIDEDELADAIAAAKAEIKNVTDALDAAIKAEKAEREAADAAIKADLKAAVAKLNKTITIITIILAIVSAACVGAIVYIFLKKRA